jgi:hypothetical protein
MKICPFCAEEIQDAAIVCKHCGRDVVAPSTASLAPPAKPEPSKANTVGTVLGFGCLGIIALMMIASFQSGSTTPTQGDRYGAYEVCQKFVTQRLRAPGSAKFPSITADRVSSIDLGEGRYSVSAYVDSQNGFGALLRMTFSCEVNWQSGQSYKLVEVKLNEDK